MNVLVTLNEGIKIMARSKIAKILGGKESSQQHSVQQGTRALKIVPQNADLIIKIESFILNFRDIEGFEAIEHLAKKGLRKYIENIKQNFSQKALRKDTIEVTTRGLARYIRYCIEHDLHPFDAEGVDSYLGHGGFLSELVSVGANPKPFTFMYDDGERMGISESTAQTIQSTLLNALERCGFDTTLCWDSIPQWNASGGLSTKPYPVSDEEQIVAKLIRGFFSLAVPLVAAKLENIELDYVTLDLGYERGVRLTEHIPADLSNSNSAFNLTMHIGYALFCYYTSFNDSVAREVCHPITINEDTSDKRTRQFVTIRGFKPRSNKTVSSTVSSEDTFDAEIEKKDGVKFLKLILELSSLYSGKQNSKLFYELRGDGTTLDLRPNSGHYVAVKLNMLTKRRFLLANHLTNTFLKFIDDGEYKEFRRSNTPYGVVMGVDIKRPVTYSKGWRLKAVTLGILGLTTIVDAPVKGILLPIQLGEKKENGKFDITYWYDGGKEEQVVEVDETYRRFINVLISVAHRYNKPVNSQNNRKAKPAYLIPIGAKSNTYQWAELSYFQQRTLARLGLSIGDYFINLNPQRLRATTSNLYSQSIDDSSTISEILGNNIKTAEQNYMGGDPEHNNLIMSQSLAILKEIIEGASVDEAKELVKERLGIEVLAHDEFLKSKLTLNINGIACAGESEFLGKTRDYHRASKRQADKLGIQEVNISCFQYDKCSECKSARIVDSVESVYKYLSFIESIEGIADFYPTDGERLIKRANSLREALDKSDISCVTVSKAEDKLIQHGIHPIIKQFAEVM